MLSDAHNPVSLSLNFKCKSHNENDTLPPPTTKLWDTNNLSSSKETFCSNINYQQINEILNNLTNLENKGPLCSQIEIDEIVNKFSTIFKEAATKSFGTKTQHITTNQDNNLPTWFGFKCKKGRKKFHRAKYLYKLNRSETNRINLQNECKTYKKTLHKYHFELKKKNI